MSPSPSITYKSFISTRHFGVEMEVNEKVDRNAMGAAVRAADPAREVSVSGWTMTGVAGYTPSSVWSVKTDSTCATILGNGHYGHEVASPKLSTNVGIITVGNVAHALRQAGCEVNNRCGVHVHADISDWSIDRAGIMLAHWVKVEAIIAQALPPHRRNNQYAKLMRKKHKIDYDQQWTGESLYQAMQPTNLEPHHNREKRVAVNLIGFATGLRFPEHGRKTAELRLPEGTLDRSDIENWTRMYVHFIEESASRTMPGDLSPVNLKETLSILGLAGRGDDFLLLSPELHETKVWFLKRILKQTNSITLFREVVDQLNQLHEPVEKFIEVVAPMVVENAAWFGVF